MMKFMRKTGGYISIFLCIILLPMVIYSAMIIDASRLQASKTQLQIAGDLVMNAAMSEYDKILQDMYGLFANAESADDLKPALNKYFNETISGITGDENNQETRQFVDELTDSIFQEGSTSQDVSNYLYMKLNDFTYDPIEESSLANPLILKSQIIDYMKYKGPVSIASNLMTKIGILKDSSNQANAVQKKIEYTQELEKLNDPMKDLWEAITEYNKYAEQYKAKNYGDKETIKSMLNKMEEKLYLIAQAKVMSNSIKEIYEDSGFDSNKSTAFNKINVDAQVGIKWDSTIDDKVETIEQAKNVLNTIINKLYFSIIDPNNQGKSEFEDAYGKFQIEYDEENKKIVSLTFGKNNETTPGYYQPTYGNLSSWIKDFSMFTDGNKVNGLETQYKIDHLSLLYDKQKRYLEYMDKISEYKVYYEYFNMLKLRYNEVYNKWENQINGDIEANTDEYIKAKEIFDAVAKNWGQSDMYKLYCKFIDSITSLNYYAESVKSECENATKEFKEYYDIVYNMNKYSIKASSKAGDIHILLIKMKEAKENYKKSIEGIEDDDIKSKMTSDLARIIKTIDDEKLTDFHALLLDISNQTSIVKVQTAIGKEGLGADIRSVKFIGKEVCSMGTIDFNGLNSEYLEANKYNIGNGYGIRDLVQEVQEVYDSGHIETSGDISPIEIINGKEDIDDDYKYTEPKKKNLREAFYYVLKNSYGKNDKGEKLHKETLKENDKKSVDEINKAVNVGDNGKPSDFTKAIEDAQTKNSGNQEGGQQDSQQVTGGSAKDIENAQNEIFNARTDVSPEYKVATGADEIPNTGGDEEKVKNNANKSAENGKSNLSKAQELLSQIGKIGQSLRDNVYLEEYFTEMFTCQTDGKKNKPVKLINGYSTTDSERPINTKNAWYNKEIEYILWGDADLDSNITKTDATIFLMRFATNAIYAFTASDIQGFANTTATALVGWTVVLVPIVQVCIVLAIALAESAYDLALLKNGDSVPILKDSKTFVCSPVGSLSNIAEKAVEKVADVAEEKINEAIDGIAKEGGKKISECESEINGMVQDYTDSIKNSIETSIDDQITTPLINSISPMLSRLDDEASNAENLVNETIDTAWKDIGSSIDRMDEGTVKSLTLEFYNNYAKDVKDDIKNAIIGEINEKKEAISVDSIHTLISEKIENILEKYLAGPINAEVSKITNQMKEEIMSHGNEAVSNLKGYVHEGMSSVSSKLTGKITETLGNGQHINKSGSGGITINYKEYCKILMFIGFIGQEENYLKRAAALIQANVRYSAKGSNPNFSMTKAYTLFYVGSTVEMKTLFPWGVSINISDVDAQGSANLDFSNLGNNSVKINYSGINGY